MDVDNKNYIFQLGNDQLTTKATYYPAELEKFNFTTFYFSEDRSGLSKDTIQRENIEAKIAPNNLVKRWWELLVLFTKRRPVAIELYLSQRPWHLFFYYLLARLFRAKVVIWCRGELRNFKIHHPLRRFVNRLLLVSADRILLRELYMKSILIEEGIYRPNKTLFFPNAIPTRERQNNRQKVSDTILFLNSFKKFRNIELVIEATEILHKKFPSIKCNLVGSTLDNQGYSPSSTEYEEMLRDMVRERGLSDVVSFYPFSSDRFEFFDDAFVFVLPADIVFCNYTLLEAMSNRMPAVVANTEGADLIVDDGLTGFVVERDAADIASAIEKLYVSALLRDKMGEASRDKIIKDYNVASRAKVLAGIFGGV
ncbi:glycosyltransferase [gamma proteobacterium HIMB55]|nr:glycosyltransferase [gamma proteobacterium HIMB55]